MVDKDSNKKRKDNGYFVLFLKLSLSDSSSISNDSDVVCCS